MDGVASPPSSAEEQPSGCAVDLDPRCPAAAAPAMVLPEEDKDEKGRGYVDSLLRISLHLLQNGLVPEVRRQGFNLMLHLWRCRWDDLCVDEWSTTSDDSDLMLCGTTDILPSKSAIAALMAEVVASVGISWNDLSPSVTFLLKRGSTEEMRWITDAIV